MSLSRNAEKSFAKSNSSNKINTSRYLFKFLLNNLDGQIFWSARNDKSVPIEKSRDYYYYKPLAADVEITGYALMSYLKRKELLKDITKIVKWLSKQRNHYGGFSSTQVC
jgi:hypothetical protein